MKMTYKLMLTGLFIVVTMISCEENTGSAPNSIKYFHSTGYGRINCCPTQCGEWYAVSFSDDAPSGWYWLGLTRQGSLRYVGRGKFFDDPNTANYDTLFYHYFGGLDSGDYELQLFRCNSRLDVGKPNNSLSRGGPETVAIEQGYTSWPCATECCVNETNGGYRRYKAFAIKDHGSLVGGAARIETYYGQLCGETSTCSDSVPAQTGCWVGIQDDALGTSATESCQIGYMIKRSELTAIVDTFVYLEVNPFDEGLLFLNLSDYWGAAVPQQYTYHDYEFFLDPSGPTVYVVFDNYTQAFGLSSQWTGKTLRYVSWSGEIDGLQTDMPGAPNDSCRFSNCSFYVDLISDPFPANFGEPDLIGTTRPPNFADDRFGAYIDSGGTDFYIWDKYPAAK